VKRILVTVVLTLVAPGLLAWGEKGHWIANEASTFDVPAELPVFFHQAYARVVYLGYDPDRWRGAGRSMDAVNAPDHFLDYEYVAALELPADRYAYLSLLDRSGTLHRFGITNTTAGFVPWRIAEICELLEQQWRLWRRAPSDLERQHIEESIVFLAGVLGHFVSDSANPHHTTIHYNGWVEANPNRYPNDCETHSRFETQFVSRQVELSDVVPKLARPALHTDYFQTALGLIRDSNSLVEKLYTLDRDGAFAWPRGTAAGREFASERLAAGASMLRDLWWSTYRNSAKPPSSRQ
jgi:hypothetical protein